jgi:hypothetical protein
MPAKGACIMKFDRTENSDCCPPPAVSSNGISAIFSPLFEPNWHPIYAETLAVFPRFVRIHDPAQATSCSCWPDLATLTEDEDERIMAYYPAEPSALSLLLVFDKRSQVLHLRVYEDDRVLMGTLVSNAIDTERNLAESL